MNRRDLLRLTVAAGAASTLGAGLAKPADDDSTLRIIDTNVSLFQWPFRRLPLDEPERLVNKLRSLGISSAWAGSFEGLLHRDISSVNERLAAVCSRYPELVPIGSINLDLPDWEEDLQRCFDEHKMPGIRLHPNYHGYGLDDSRFSQLLALCREKQRFVQIAVCLEDTRTQHPRLSVPDVDLSPLPAAMHQAAGAMVQLLNYRPRQPLLKKLAEAPGIYFDIARVEGTGGIADLLQSVSSARVMLGSHAPFLIPESTLIRVYESMLSEEELPGLLSDTANEFWRRSAAKGSDQ